MARPSKLASWEVWCGPEELEHSSMPEPVAHVAAYYIECAERERKLGWLSTAKTSEQNAILHFNKARMR